eukprot:4033227-Pyramimonas_sp.AAC.1
MPDDDGAASGSNELPLPGFERALLAPDGLALPGLQLLPHELGQRRSHRGNPHLAGAGQRMIEELLEEALW